MKEFKHIISDPEGIHARPAGLLVKKAVEFNSSITIELDEKSADAKRIFALMSLGAKKNMELTIRIEGEDEEKAADEIKTFLQDNL